MVMCSDSVNTIWRLKTGGGNGDHIYEKPLYKLSAVILEVIFVLLQIVCMILLWVWYEIKTDTSSWDFLILVTFYSLRIKIQGI